jgi:hypothetical protein
LTANGIDQGRHLTLVRDVQKLDLGRVADQLSNKVRGGAVAG